MSVVVERRLRRDRRAGLDRRIVDRRLFSVEIEVEQRAGRERRASGERRSPVPRRGWIDRRGQDTSPAVTPDSP